MVAEVCVGNGITQTPSGRGRVVEIWEAISAAVHG